MLYTVMCLNLKNGVEFAKNFDSPYLMNKFINKCKRGKSLKVISVIKNY